MTHQRSEWNKENTKSWRLELIKQRHREVVLSKKGKLHDAIMDHGGDGMPELEESEDLASLKLAPDYELEAD